MAKPNLHTSSLIKESFKEIAPPTQLRAPLSPKLTPVVKKKALVSKGAVLAQNPAPGVHSLGWLHSPMDGVVSDVTATAIIIETPPPPKEGEAAPAFEPVAKTDLSSLKGDDLCRKLLEMGVDTTRFRPAKSLVVNALNPEPGVTIHEQLLKDAPQTLETGLVLLERIINPANIYLVSAPGVNAKLHGCQLVEETHKYPSTLDTMVRKKATGTEKPEGVSVVSLLDVYNVGKAAETQLPLIEALLTIGASNYRLPVGVPAEEALKAAGIQAGEGVKVILGGPMKGTAIFDLSQGLPKDARALTLVPQGLYPEVTDNPCVVCGECVLVCPVRIHPGMIST